MNNLLLAIVLVFVIGTSVLLPVMAESELLVSLSKTDGLSYRAQLHVQDDEIYVIWQDDSVGDGDIFFSKGSLNNFNFEDPINLSDNARKSSFPRFSISGDNISITWYDYTPGTSDIYFAQSNDGGTTFETINLSQNEGVSYNPWVKSSGNNVYIVWNDDTSQDKNLQRESKNQTKYFDVSAGTFEILFASSHDGGSSFEITNLSNSPVGSQNPRMAASGNNVYVIWSETEKPRNIFLAVSNDGGLTFNEPVNVSNSPNKSEYSVIQPYENFVHVLWSEQSQDTSDIFYAKSNDNGLTFDTPIKLSDNGIDLKLTRDTQMIVSDYEVFVVWYENSPSSSGVFFVKSIDGGITFSKPLNLSGYEGKVSYPQIAKHNDNLYVIWNDYSMGNSEVFLRTSLDGGETFGSIQNLSNDLIDSFIFVLGPQIATTQNEVITIFEKRDIAMSNLYLKTLNHNPIQEAGTLSLKTINGRINVLVDLGENLPDVEKPANFTLRFVDANAGELVENVNYSFTIEDLDGNKIVSKENQRAQTGTDIQDVQFSKQGQMTVIIDVQGTGDELPYDTFYAGKTSAVISVIPEFPLGLFAVMIPVISIVILLNKIFSYKSNL